MVATALLIIADGSEEMEAIITADVLRRGGVTVTVAGLDGSQPVTCSRGVKIVPDSSLNDVKSAGPYSVIILPGGIKGSEMMAAAASVKEILTEQEKCGRIVAAICAAPIALKAHRIGFGKTITSHPSIRERIEEGGLYNYSEDRVVVDGSLVTSRGPGTAFEFALTLVKELMGAEKADAITPPMLLK